MSRRSVEAVMDRLLTDAALRARFDLEPLRVLAELSFNFEIELTLDEMRAFLRVAPDVWSPTAGSRTTSAH